MNDNASKLKHGILCTILCLDLNLFFVKNVPQKMNQSDRYIVESFCSSHICVRHIVKY